MVRHVIVWTLKDEFDEAQKAEIKAGIKAGLEGLKGKVIRAERCFLEARTGHLLEASLSGRLMMLSVKLRDYSSSLSFAVKAMRE